MSEPTPLLVVVVDDHQATRAGMVALLAAQPRLRMTDPVGHLSELALGGRTYDVALMDLVGVGTADQLQDCLSRTPTVVCTAMDGWRARAGAWACGARAVLGKDVGSHEVAGALWDAVHAPDVIRPQLAQALLDACAELDLPASAQLLAVLGDCARGRRPQTALERQQMPAVRYSHEIDRLRATLRTMGFDRLDTVLTGAGTGASGESLPGLPDLQLSPQQRQVLELFADGYAYGEIAALMHIAEHTVKNHVLNAMDRAGILEGRSSDVRLLFALYVTGRHPRPELLRRRLLASTTRTRSGVIRPRGHDPSP